MSAAATAPQTAPDVVAPPPGNPRFPLFDGLRALAALGVIVSHAGYFSGASQDAWYGPLVANGTAGVTVFFVLSGFLLYRPFLAADLEDAPPIRLGQYARRRLLRIVPAYWLALTVLAVYPGLLGVFTGEWWRYYGFLQVYTGGDSAAKGLAAAWSLCIEVSFYALLPLYAAGMRRVGRKVARARRLRLELVVLAALAAASVATRALSLASGGTFLELTLAGTFAWFAAGMALAVLSVGPAPVALTGFVRRHPGLLWLGAALSYGVLCLLLRVPQGTPLRYTEKQWLVQHVLVLVPAVLLVAPAVWDGGHGAPRRLLRLPPVAWLGLVSYGLYLWQGGCVLELWRRGARDWVPGAPFVVMALATLAGSAACAAISYYVLERPLMRWKRPPPGRPRATRGRAAAAASARAPGPGSARGSRR
jgi:peptidoglycan/LPS O-acetylase OafA/YrhL